MSTEFAPLHKILKQSVQWQWKDEQQKAFEKAKTLLTSLQLLVHFNPTLEIHLACGALHLLPDRSEKPFGFVSQTLIENEKNYFQLEKDIKHFHSYLHGHKFVLQTDHQPLTTLFSETKNVPSQALSQILHWALLLQSYECSVISDRPVSILMLMQ